MSAKELSAASSGFSSNSSIRSMMTEDEKALYFTTARDAYRAHGTVIEMGSWLGGGTVQICRGLDASTHDWRLTVYDRFSWSSDAQRKYPEAGLQVGQSFLPLFKRNLEPHLERITPIVGELTDISSKLPVPQKVELLFVDAPKSWSLLRAVLAHLGPHLMRGASVVFQDFLHIRSRQIIWLVMSIPQFSITATVAEGTAVLCTAREPITDISAVPPNMNSLAVSDLMMLWERAAQMLPDKRRGELSAGMAIDLYARKDKKAAIHVLDVGVVDKPWQSHIIQRVQKLIKFGNPKDKGRLTAINNYLVARQRQRISAEFLNPLNTPSDRPT